MATTITAGNATNGAAISSDNTGILELKTGTGAGTTAMTLNASQNVGVGTTSPSVSGLEISRATGVSPTPVELRLTTTTNDSGWSTTNPWGRLSFYSADASVGGAKVHASIQTTAQSSAGGNSNLDFFVTDTANGTLFRTLSFQGAGTNTTQTLFYSGGGTNTMTLDASGRLLVGTTTAIGSWGSAKSQELQIAASGATYPGLSAYAFSTNAGAGGMINLGRSRSTTVGTMTATQSGDALGYLIFEGVNSSNALTGGGYISVVQNGAAGASYIPAEMRFYTSDATNGTTERARITSTGNFAIGTTNTTNYGNIGLYVSGNSPGYTAVSIGASGGDYGVIGYNTGFTSTAGTYKAIASDGMSWIRFLNGSFEFWRQTSATAGTNYTGTQGMTLTSDGALWVGNTTRQSTSNHTFIQNVVSDWTANFQCNTATAANNYGILINYSGSSPNGTINEFLICNDTVTTRAEIRSNGGLANFQANNVNLSDRREKTNFAPAKDYLDVICAIPVQTFNYIDQAEDDPGLTLGVVAQDVQAVAPEMVMESDWSSGRDGSKMRLSIYQTDLQYALMKCIQELKAELDATKAEVAALKGAAQ